MNGSNDEHPALAAEVRFQAAHAQLSQDGFAIVPSIYSMAEVKAILACIDAAGRENPAFMQSGDLFAIRQLLQELPALLPLLQNPHFADLVQALGGRRSFISKAIYFDKPAASNWFVGYHQDLSISVAGKHDTPGYSRWTHKRGITGVHPPLEIQQRTITLRIHLDDTDMHNGALRVIPGSHLKGEFRATEIDWTRETEVVCDVPCGGIMLMKPLTLHASRRSDSTRRRRVIHLEICDLELEGDLQWKERTALQSS